MPKPWVASSEVLRDEGTPKCRVSEGEGGAVGGMDCEDRDIWLGLHEDFRERRKVSDAVLWISTIRDVFLSEIFSWIFTLRCMYHNWNPLTVTSVFVAPSSLGTSRWKCS
jgi:hypothetical protein